MAKRRARLETAQRCTAAHPLCQSGTACRRSDVARWLAGKRNLAALSPLRRQSCIAASFSAPSTGGARYLRGFVTPGGCAASARRQAAEPGAKVGCFLFGTSVRGESNTRSVAEATMNTGSSIVACPHCRGQIVAEATTAGQEVGCPHCYGRLMMPAVSVVPPPPLAAIPVEGGQTDPLDFLEESPTASRPRRRLISSYSMTRPSYGSTSTMDANSSFWFFANGPAILIGAIVIGIVAVLVEFISAVG